MTSECEFQLLRKRIMGVINETVMEPTFRFNKCMLVLYSIYIIPSDLSDKCQFQVGMKFWVLPSLTPSNITGVCVGMMVEVMSRVVSK